MFALEQNLWIILIFYINIFMPMSCQAALEKNKVRTKDEEDLYTFTMKPMRSLLDWDSHDYGSSSSSGSTAFVGFFICFIIILIAILIRCCIRLANEPYEDTSNRVVHPPPRNHHYPGITTAPPRSSSRPLAPPRTSSSLILLGDGTSSNSVLLGIDNQSFLATAATITPANVRQERRTAQSQQGVPERNNSNPTLLFDLPPTYDSVVNTNVSNTDSNPSSNSDKDAPPKYSDSLLQKY